MFAQLMVVSLMMVTAMIGKVGGDIMMLAEQRELHIVARKKALLSRELVDYYAEYKAFPDGEEAWQGTAGYQHVRHLFGHWSGYARSDVLTGDMWTGRRALVWAQLRRGARRRQALLEDNACGDAPFATALLWCPPMARARDVGVLSEDRYRYRDIAAVRTALTNLSDRFSSHMVEYGEFPKLRADGVALAAPESAPLAQIVGYAGGPKGCGDVFGFEGVPLGCEDMFDLWGGEIGYHYEGPRHIVLYARTPYTRADGQRV